jgi:hypothetical protein
MRNGVKHAHFLMPAFIVLPCLLIAGASLANDDAAHALAERFAAGTGSQEQISEQSKTEETEILERARSEAAVREALASKAQSEAVARLNRATELKRQAEALRAAQKQLLESQAAAAETASDMKPEPVAETDTVPTVDQTAAADQERLDRARETSELSEKLKHVRETRPTGAMGLGMSPAEVATPNAPVTEAAPSQDQRLLPREAVRNATSVTVLLVMEPGTTGIRMGSQTADPVICLDQWCYVSTGTETPAKVMSRGATLGPINTLGLRAGACRKSLTCIYRGLDIAAYFAAGAKAASLQPVDLRYLHHDRRQAMPLRIDNGCSAQRSEIRCAKALHGKGWTAWIIPENLAVEAGADGLQAALDAGLTTNASALQAASFKPGR